MRFGKIYTEWLLYLKKKGLYVKYMYDYARTNEYLRIRNASIESGEYWSSEFVRLNTRKITARFFTGYDQLMQCNGDNMTIQNLLDGTFNLNWYRNDLTRIGEKRVDWAYLAKEFGKEYGYIKTPRRTDDFWGTMLWDDEPVSATASTAQIAASTRLTRNEEAHVGQWYDRFYNGGRNNNRNNNRWRR